HPSLVVGPRILASRSTPAEAKPETEDAVTYEALAVSSDGTLAQPPIDWALCIAQKPLAETGPIASKCMVPSADYLVHLGEGASADATLPIDGCRLFGSTPPDPEPGQPPARPVDPDTSGGYYQPVRLLLQTDAGRFYAAAQTRL